MFTIKRAQGLVIVSTVLYILMIIMNVLAVLLPLNGLSTAVISSRYDTLFAPTGFTFSIWGVIYLALALEVILSISKLREIKDNFSHRQKFLTTALFSISSLLNGIWIVFWHFELLFLSVVTMVLLFVVLLLINIQLKKASIIDRLPFSLYFGWITIALIANIAAFIVSLGVSYNSVGAVIQTSMIIIIASIITALTIFLQKDYVYGLVVIWALIGIIVRHVDVNQFNLAYQGVLDAAIIALVIVTLSIVMISVYTLIKKRRTT